MKLKCLNQPIPKFARPSDPFLMFPGSDGFMNPADAWHVFTGCSTISSRQNQSIDVGLLPRCQSKKCLPPRDPRSGQVKSQCQRCCSAMSVKPSNRTSPSWSAVCILIIGHFGEKKVPDFQPQYVFLCSSKSSLFGIANPASSHWRILCSESTCKRFTPTSTLQFRCRPGRHQHRYRYRASSTSQGDGSPSHSPQWKTQ